jgi:hypothetical protein
MAVCFSRAVPRLFVKQKAKSSGLMANYGIQGSLLMKSHTVTAKKPVSIFTMAIMSTAAP